MLAGQFHPCESNTLALEPVTELLVGFQELVVIAAADPEEAQFLVGRIGVQSGKHRGKIGDTA